MTRKKILLAVDSTSLISLGEIFFHSDKFAVSTAFDGREALHLVATERPDLAIIDAGLPGIGGDGCCAAIKQDAHTAAMPVLMLAHPGQTETVDRCRAAGCDAFLEKPLSTSAVVSVVSRLLFGERRRETRVAVRLPVSYGIEAPGRLVDYTVDLSTGGMFLDSKKALPIDTLLTVDFTLPRSDTAIVCRVRVAWRNGPILRSSQLFPQGMGLEFLALDPRQLLAIRTFLTIRPDSRD